MSAVSSQGRPTVEELNHTISTPGFPSQRNHDLNISFQVQVQGDVVVYNTVNMMNTVHMNNTNNVELQQSGGVTVVGDEAKVNFHQHPTS